MYYRLTYTASSNKEWLGDFILNGSKPLNIGQAAICNVQLPESAMYEPIVYASILQQEDGGEWYLVRRTDCHHVLINGVETSIAQVLKSGDLLSFDDGTVHAELKFETFDDGEYDASSGFVYKKHKSNKRYYMATMFLALFALGVAAYSIFFSHQKDLRHCDLNQFFQSVYHITADSVYLLCDGMTVDSIELTEVAAGTAFLTVDGNDTLFVTASIGIALCPKDGSTYRTLLHNADEALYEVKETGRNGYGFYGEGRSY